MSIHRFDHIDLRVSNFAEARKFYDVIFPALGFPRIRAAETEVPIPPRVTARRVPSSASTRNQATAATPPA